MRIGKVIGQVVATVKDESINGYRLFIVQGLDQHMREIGKPYVAIDSIHCAGPGDVVYIAFKRG